MKIVRMGAAISCLLGVGVIALAVVPVQTTLGTSLQQFSGSLQQLSTATPAAVPVAQGAPTSAVPGTYQGHAKPTAKPLPLIWKNASCWFNAMLQLLYALQPPTLDRLLMASDGKLGGAEIRTFFNQMFAGAKKKELETPRFAAQKAMYALKIPYEIDEDGDTTYIELNGDGSEIIVLKDLYNRFGWKNLTTAAGTPLIDIQVVQWPELDALPAVLAKYLRGQQVLMIDVATQTFEKRIYKKVAKKGQAAPELKYYTIPLTYQAPSGTYDLVGFSVTQSKVDKKNPTFYKDYHSLAIVKGRDGTWYFADDDDDQERQYREIDDPDAQMNAYQGTVQRVPAKTVEEFVSGWPKFTTDSMYHPAMLVYEKR
jgi:hypothetical protein